MKQIAKFEKVSFEQFKKDCGLTTTDDLLKEIYDNIKLPQRATSGSAGYDFYLPFNTCLMLDSKYVIPTGIRCKIKDGWVLSLYPRSGLGFKFGVRLSNTVGIIDSDYYNSSNEGHIILSFETGSYDNYRDNLEKYSEYGSRTVRLSAGSAICQGIFTKFGITEDDSPATEKRDGGFGSTDKLQK